MSMSINYLLKKNISLQRLTVAMQVKDTDSGGAEEVPVDVMSSLMLHAQVNLLGAPTCTSRRQPT